jgi:hypothetical protein
MATTTNYGWTTPDDTALVKDGASAIRTLGTSVDTTTKNLNPSTTLGDIEYRSSTANTNTRLGIGTTGQVLAVSGGVPAWTTSSSGGMTLLSTTTLSGTSTTISGIDQTYTDLLIYVYGVTFATGSAKLRISWNGSSTHSVVGAYKQNTTVSTRDYTGSTNLTDDISQTAGVNSITIKVTDYAGSTLKPLNYYHYSTAATGNQSGIFGGAITGTTSAITSVKFDNDGPYNFNAGTVKIWGLK